MTTNFEPQWIVGFTDGEGCFNLDIHVKKDMNEINCFSNLKHGLQMQPEFSIVQHERDVQLLHAFKDYFQCGTVTINQKDHTSTRYQWRVKSVLQLTTIIIPFFQKHQLKTKKKIEFKRFTEICLLMQQGYHKESTKNFLEIVEKGQKLRYDFYRNRSKKPSKVSQIIEELKDQNQ